MLFARERALQGEDGETALMRMCSRQPQLLGQAPWFVQHLFDDTGRQCVRGVSALAALLQADLRGFTHFGSKWFRLLLNREKAIVCTSGRTQLMQLCAHNPQLLEFGWALELVERLSGRRDNQGASALQLLLQSPRAQLLDFTCQNFRRLWAQRKERDAPGSHTPLMLLCASNPQLLCQEHWFYSDLLQYAGRQDIIGECALSLAFASDKASEVDFSAPAATQLLMAERDLQRKDGQTALMALCYWNPQLLGESWAKYFVEK